ncbi:Growth-regulating factor [Quillaja saponaria]|uniref:Growth-regulating factor n=1 Tax=Quillaja saponaria TaxID=32244 RepID=A0AAD7PYB2_QUISA|nr:Growth-regulating factor [Quillaja saponaria]
MRIRKRQVPFPLSSLTPVPLSDLNLINRSPVVQLNHPDSTTTKDLPPNNSSIHPQEYHNLLKQDDATTPTNSKPSDQQLTPIGKASNGRDSSNDSGAHKERMEDCLELLPWEDERGEEVEEKSTDDSTRKGSNLDSEIDAAVLLLSSPSHQACGRSWSEGEKAIPLKKRRGIIMESNNSKKVKVKVKVNARMNKKCLMQNGDNEEEEEDEETKVGVNYKKAARGSAVMEGSRCSRVNGRGWRCCQQTLVGYSLCEHHLGKGRLRSMNSVRSRSNKKETCDPLLSGDSSLASDNQKQTKLRLSDSSDDEGEGEGEDENEDEDDDEKQPLMMTKKRMKLGIVKARSLSSLLGQNNH